MKGCFSQSLKKGYDFSKQKTLNCGVFPEVSDAHAHPSKVWVHHDTGHLQNGSFPPPPAPTLPQPARQFQELVSNIQSN